MTGLMRKLTWVGALGAYVAMLLATVLFMPLATAQSILPTLTISHYKITSNNGQFIELYNHTDQPIDMSTVQLAYYNNYDLSKATSSKLVSLTGTLPAHSYYMITDGAVAMCYQAVAASASLNFSSTAGMVQVIGLRQESFGGPFVSEVYDHISWSRAVVDGVTTLPATTQPDAFLRRQWDGQPVVIGGGEWQIVQPSKDDPCVLETVSTEKENVEMSEEIVLLPPTLPPVRFVAPQSSTKAVMNRNPGKMAPVINELLPNPASPQTDADDEFIELYNPNDSVFDLTGFKLAFGNTKPKKYTFPEGTVLQPKEFRAFTSGDTSISLSNTEAQVWLLDPNEKVIGQSDPYKSAKDGQAWALSNGTWVWTTTPTPNAENTIAIPASGSQKSAAAVLGIAANNNGASSTIANANGVAALDDAAPLHPAVLAGVGLLAVGYAVYEYRHDISNRIFQLRRHAKSRRASR